jgi:hypothetical protein
MRAISKWALEEAEKSAARERPAPSKIKTARERLDAMKANKQ